MTASKSQAFFFHIVFEIVYYFDYCAGRYSCLPLLGIAGLGNTEAGG